MVSPPHPITVVLQALAPIIGANFVAKSSRDAQTEENIYPLIEYVIHKEGSSTYDSSTDTWRVELVLQLDYLLQENNVQQCLPAEELTESLAIQAVQFDLTGKIRAAIQLMIKPGSLGSSYNENDFLWSKYDFKLVRFVESAYFRKHGMDELTGASSLFVLSLLDIDNVICCLPNDQELLYSLLDPQSSSGRLLKHKIDNP